MSEHLVWLASAFLIGHLETSTQKLQIAAFRLYPKKVVITDWAVEKIKSLYSGHYSYYELKYKRPMVTVTH